MNDWNSNSSSPLQHHDSPQKPFLTRWLTRFGRWIRNLFAVIGFAYTIIPILILWAVFHHLQGPKKQAASTAKSSGPQSLWLPLDASILDAEPRMGSELIRQILGSDDGIYLPELRATLRQAAADTNIKDLNLVVDGLHGSMADVEELRGIIADFKTSGKPVTSYVLNMDNAALLVTSVTDKIVLAPVSEVMIPGPAFPSVYVGEALRKVGVDIQVIRAGKYKNAFEAFIANEPSAESKEAMGSLESSLRNHMVKLVAEGRKKQDSEAFLWFKESIFTAAKAKELGMVDELAYPPAIDFDDGTHQTIDEYSGFAGSSSSSQGYSLSPQKGIALIEAAGEIVSSGSDGPLITPESMQEELEWARTNTDIAAVVLRVASPGGSAAASDLIWESVRRLNAEKPVIASFGSVAASGGYYISSAARKIIADPATITGSIGVIGMIPDFEPFKEKYGITFPITTQSNRAAILSGGKKMTPADLQYMEDAIDDTYRTFKTRVADGRKMTLDKVESLAQGRVYSGLQAKELGLIDELGSLKDAIQLAKKEAGLDEKKLYPLHRYEAAQFNLSDCLTSFSKMKRCLRRHGSNLRITLKDELLGEEGRAVQAVLRAKSIAKKDRISAIYTGGIPQ